MPKIIYNNISFDSELEVNYYKKLEELKIDFIYHPYPAIKLAGRNYTPDFIVFKDEKIEIVETKGYNQFSFMADNIIHSQMKAKSQEELREYLKLINLAKSGYSTFLLLNQSGLDTKPVFYKKIKYLKSYGFVDWDFKNPNSLANKRKEKIVNQKDEIKELKTQNRILLQYAKYSLSEKLSKRQEIRLQELSVKIKESYLGATEE